jgi:hypothetical protein
MLGTYFRLSTRKKSNRYISGTIILSVFLVTICFVLLCTFIRISNTQPLLDDGDEDQNQVDTSFLNNYFAASGRSARNYPRGFDIPESLFDHHRQQQLYYQNKQYNPDNVQLAKRIIMLPRVGRRSVRSISLQ